MSALPLAGSNSRLRPTPYRPSALALLNRIGAQLGELGLGGEALVEARLVRAAQQRTGLSDFGDEGFREALGVLVHSIEHEAKLHSVGRLITKARLLRSLTTRLKLAQAQKQHPEAFATPLPAPLVIAGLQRTGTTLLHRLLACDPQLRSLRSYEAVAPLDAEHSWLARLSRKDARWFEAKLSEHALRYMAPDFFAIHPVEADAPEEDILLLDYAFLSTVPEATLHVPSYASWLERQNHQPAYACLDQLLRWLSHRAGPRRWVLKTPHHLEHLDTLRAVFPGVRVIQTHRDPTRTLASFCSMVWHARGVFSDEVDAHEIGRHWSRKVQRMLARALEVRAAAGEQDFVDVPYAALLQSPLQALERLYAQLEMPLEPQTKRAMQACLRASPQHKFGSHRYALADFGLSAAWTEAAFAEYRDRFRIPRESAP